MELAIYHILALSCLYFTFDLFFSRSKRFKLNRGLLLLFPVVPILLHFSPSWTSVESNIVEMNPIQLDEIVVSTQSSVSSSWSFLDFYLVGSLMLLLIIIVNYFFTFNKLRRLNFDSKNESGIRLAIDQNEDNYSFFNYVVLNNKDQMILNHEICHVKSGHSIDILIYNLYKVLFWFNPFIYLMERKLKLNHEYEADHYASKEDQLAYANELLNQVFGTSSIQFINQFNNQNSIKMRIKILKQKKKGSWLRYLTILPMFGALMVLGAWESDSNPVKNLITVHGDGDEVYDKVDKMPEFKGGMDGLIQYLHKSIKYPKESEKANEEGKVFIEFVVEANGKISNAKVVKSSSDRLDTEALRVINAMPKWKPGEKDGKKVNVKMVLPIVFKLS